MAVERLEWSSTCSTIDAKRVFRAGLAREDFDLDEAELEKARILCEALA